MNIDSKAAGEVVIVLSENASLTDLRLRLERVGVVFQASSVQVKGNVASRSRNKSLIRGARPVDRDLPVDYWMLGCRSLADLAQAYMYTH